MYVHKYAYLSMCKYVYLCMQACMHACLRACMHVEMDRSHVYNPQQGYIAESVDDILSICLVSTLAVYY